MEKEIEGFPGYSVTDDGRVFSTKYRSKRELVQSKLNDRYLKVGLQQSGVQKTVLVHRLVATAFLDSISGKPHVNHKDGNKLNNGVDNLEWSDYSNNIKHAWDTGLRKRPSKEVCRARMPNHVRAYFNMEAV